MATHSKDKSETSASHPRRETRSRTGAAEKPSRAKEATPVRDETDARSSVPETPEEEASAAATDAQTGGDHIREAAVYLREHDFDDVVRDAVDVVRHNPVVVLLVFGGVILGGAAVVASLRQQQGRTQSHEGAGTVTAHHVIGAKTHETLGRMREAAFSFALAKVIDSIDNNFPGFREHFDKSSTSA